MIGHSIFARNSRRRDCSDSDSHGGGDGANTMSSDTQTQTDAERRMTKKVDIVCYLDNPDELTRRQFADEIADDRDMFEREEVTHDNRDVYLVHGSGKDKLYSCDADEAQAKDWGDFEVEISGDVETEMEFFHDPLAVMKSVFRDVIADSYPQEVIDERSWYAKPDGRVRDAEFNTKIRYYYDFERMPMLRHKSEIEQDDMYVDPDTDYLAVKVRAKIVDLPEDVFDVVNDELLGSAMTALGKHDLVRRVRVYDCESETKEAGVCFNI